MTWRPLEGRYWPMLISALAGLVPFILITTALHMYQKQMTQALGIAPVRVQVVLGLSIAGYCFGALLGGDLSNRLMQRRLFLVCELLFTAGTAMVALSSGLWVFAVGQILAGFATGIMLVAALPPVVQSFPAARFPRTAVFINIGFFGAVTAGPLIGGAVAGFGHWRAFYAGLALIGFLNVGLAFLCVPPNKPPNPKLPVDLTGIALGLAASALPFWGSAELSRHNFQSVWFWAPMSAGLAAFVLMIATEYFKKNALSPVRAMWSTIPIIGTATAMIGGGVLVTLLDLAIAAELKVGHHPPIAAGLVFWPQIIASLVAALIVGWALSRRWLPLCILAGMLMLVLAGGLMLAADPARANMLMLSASGILGLGAGLTVSPGLFIAGFPLPAAALGRIYALIELVRSVADFVIAPVILRVARDASGPTLSVHGIDVALRITMLLTVACTLFGISLWVSGGAGLRPPDLRAWIDEHKIAMTSPKLGAVLRQTGAVRGTGRS